MLGVIEYETIRGVASSEYGLPLGSTLKDRIASAVRYRYQDGGVLQEGDETLLIAIRRQFNSERRLFIRILLPAATSPLLCQCTHQSMKLCIIGLPSQRRFNWGSFAYGLGSRDNPIARRPEPPSPNEFRRTLQSYDPTDAGSVVFFEISSASRNSGCAGTLTSVRGALP
jgi:hypothetical protein